jgi:hypothetical protein
MILLWVDALRDESRIDIVEHPNVSDSGRQPGLVVDDLASHRPKREGAPLPARKLKQPYN